jgi:hypothetical protein
MRILLKFDETAVSLSDSGGYCVAAEAGTNQNTVVNFLNDLVQAKKIKIIIEGACDWRARQ